MLLVDHPMPVLKRWTGPQKVVYFGSLSISWGTFCEGKDETAGTEEGAISMMSGYCCLELVPT
jgi:hypothetical protein